MKTFALLYILALSSFAQAARRRPAPVIDAALSMTPSGSQQPSGRASTHYSPVNPELTYLLGTNSAYPELAALARAAREHRTRGRAAAFVPSPQFDPQEEEKEAVNYVTRTQEQTESGSGGEQTEFRPLQPTRPVYHATPLHQFVVKAPVEEGAAATFISQPREQTGGDASGGVQTGYRPRQPITPVYHATPLHQFVVKTPSGEGEAANDIAQPHEHEARGASGAEHTEFRPRQPITPVYHATPLRPFGVLLDTAEESRDANSFSAPTSRGVGADGDEVASTGGTMGRLTEAIFPGRGVGKHSSRVAVVQARSHEHEHEHAEEQEHKGGAYEFGYAVRDERGGNFFGHSERRDAAGSTSGTYHVFLPDGRLQSVQYKADHAGFHAHVSYKRPELTH